MPDLGEQEYITGIDFCPNNVEKVKITQFDNFSNFIKYRNSQLKLYDLYSPKGMVLKADLFTADTNHQALQDIITFGRFKDTCVFLVEALWNRP